MWGASRRGRRCRWQSQDIEYLEEKLLTEQRTYSSRQLRELLKKHRQVNLSEHQIREILKKRKYIWKRTRASTARRKSRIHAFTHSKVLWNRLFGDFKW